VEGHRQDAAVHDHAHRDPVGATERTRGGVVAGQDLFSFDPTTPPGYVWHCHILDHEDNEMMRPYLVAK
jgi:FtsP/CotA-like multicopper oxidase with cupredoxin domain